MKKLFLALIATLLTLPTCLAADGDIFTQGDLKFTVTSEAKHEVSVGAKDPAISGDIIIPSTVTKGRTEYSVSSIGDGAFQSCHSLTSVEIPNSVTSIGDDAFYGCKNLVSIDIPNSVESIGDQAFTSCSALSSVKIGKSITSFGTNVFQRCNDIKEIYCAIEDPANVTYGKSLFPSKLYDAADLYVPETAIEKYMETDPWNKFKSIRGFDFSGVDTLLTDLDMTASCDIYTLGGEFIGHDIENLSHGIYIVRQGNIVKKIYVKLLLSDKTCIDIKDMSRTLN